MQKNHRPGQHEKEGCPVPQGGGGKHISTRAAGEGRMSRSTAGEGRRRRKDVTFHRGERGTIYRYAYIMVYKLDLGRGGEGGKHMAAGEGRMSRSTGGGGGKLVAAREEGCPVPQGGRGENVYRYIIVDKLNQGSRRRKDVPFHSWGGPQAKEGCNVPQGGEGNHISLCLYNGL